MTPILDLEQPVPEPLNRHIFWWIGAAIGLMLAVTSILQDEGILPAWRIPAANGLLFLPLAYLAIAVHEFGHAAAAKLVGINTGAISVGPLTYSTAYGRRLFRWDWRRWGGGFFKPLTGEIGLDPAPFAWSVAGGPIASLLLTAGSILAWLRYGDGQWSWIGALFWVSLLTLALSILPLSSGVAKTDGARLWQLTRHPEQARQIMALLAVQSEEANGLRPREWNPLLFEAMMQIGRSNPEYPWCQLMAFYRALDQGSEQEAMECLERALASSARAGRQIRLALYLEAACSSALVRKNAANARAWQARASKLRKPQVGPADAGIAMCEGRYADALGNWAAARARMDRLHADSGLIRFAKAKWSEFEEECRAGSVDNMEASA